jgi:hypothetical protein
MRIEAILAMPDPIDPSADAGEDPRILLERAQELASRSEELAQEALRLASEAERLILMAENRMAEGL